MPVQALRMCTAKAVLSLMLLACTRDNARPDASDAEPGRLGATEAGIGGAHADSHDATGTPTRLAPAADCVHPPVVEACLDGGCIIPAGCFIMGAPRDELGAGVNSNVQVQVTLTRGFWMMQTEVTNEQWSRAGWGMPLRDVSIGEQTCLDPTCPVGNVSFFDAVSYANWRSASEGLAACYTIEGCTGATGEDLACGRVAFTSGSAYECDGYRLPMEAEWEYAARAGVTTAFYSGGIETESLGECVLEPALEASAWYCHNSEGRAHAVGAKQPNSWGLFDMLGNIYEWTNDLRNGLGYGAGPLSDPPGSLTPGRELTPSGTDDAEILAGRVIRGGNHVSPGDGCTAAKRGDASSELGSSGVGFRLARSLAPR